MTISSARSSEATAEQPRSPIGVVRWGPAALVALGAAIATAHGLYEVAVASKVPGPIAWLYPLVTDGLALVAYTATRRLAGKAAGYSWACVVLAAGLSGLAQAVFLAADTVQAAPALRFGVGAWPAVAAGLAAHLLHLLLTADRAKSTTGQLPVVSAADGADTPQPIEHSDPAQVEPATATAVASTSREGSEQPASEPVTSTDTDPRVVDIARRLDRGEDLTGPSVAAEFGLADRSGRRLLNEARAHLEQHQPLHLVTDRETSA